MNDPVNWFYQRNYQLANEWLIKHGFRGLTPFHQVFGGQANPVVDNLTNSDNGQPNDQEDDVCDVPETELIDSDYLTAIRITRQHQSQLQQQRLHDSNHQDSWYVDISQKETYSIRSKAPTQDTIDSIDTIDYRQLIQIANDSERILKYQQFYNQECESPEMQPEHLKRIMEMENELQFNFERFTDQHQPPFWPLLPFKIK